MAADDDLRLAALAHRDGRPGRRDALLTLALASCGPDDRSWAAQALAGLIARHPDHIFTAHRSLSAALDDPTVVAAILALRSAYPPAKVRRLIDRDAACRGPFTGRRESLSAAFDELASAPLSPSRRRSTRHARPDLPEPAPAPLVARRARAAVGVGVGAAVAAGASAGAADRLPGRPEAMVERPSRTHAPASAPVQVQDRDGVERLRAYYLTVLLAAAGLLAALPPTGAGPDRAA